MPGYPLQAWLLRVWRTEIANLTQHQVASSVYVKKNTISMWERAERGLTFAHLHALDRCYDAGGALADVALAMGTPSGLPPRRSWVHNPQGPSGPVWAWCRPMPGHQHLSLQMRWGTRAFRCSSACDDRGLFLWSPVSVPHPPLGVDLAEPGWVDFGRGTIPDELGIPVFDVSCPAEQGLTADRAADGPMPVEITQPFTAAQWRALRECRCLSRRAAVGEATALMPDEPVTDDQLHELERGAQPRARYLRSRLDLLYRADGHTGIEAVKPTVGRRGITVTFPSWWVGPVWFSFVAKHDQPANVEVHRDATYKPLEVTSGSTVTCRKPTDEPVPFRLLCPPSWAMTAGMGMHPAASDISRGWLLNSSTTPRTAGSGGG